MFPALATLCCLVATPATGTLHPSVTCQASPAHSYALYLPSSYREDRLWPVIFVFSPSGNGAEAAALFQAGAERLGWIVVASNDSRNGPMEPVRAAQGALWKEAFSRFKADPKRVYAAGFSGGARVAMDLAMDRRRSVIGLISIGAFGLGRTLGPGHLAHALLCGEEDWNQVELAMAWERLREAKGRRVWMEQFPGGHRWAPEGLIAEAMTFLELSAGLQGRQARDAEGEAAFRTRREGSAQALTASADPAQAWRCWRDVAALEGAPPEARLQVDRLSKDPELKSALNLEHSFVERAHRLRSDSAYGIELQRLVGVAAGQGPLALDARRLLERERGALEERCREALNAQAWEMALRLARGLVGIGDRACRGGVYAAMALAMMGRKGEALAELKEALERGFRPTRPLREQPLLAPLREEPAFRAMAGP